VTDGSSELPAFRTWPPGRTFPDAEALAATCSGCSAHWRVHQSLGGFRLLCACGAWLEVPRPTTALPTVAGPQAVEAAALPAPIGSVRDERGLVLLPGDDGETVFAPIRTDLPMAPGTLRRASASNQARWSTRTVLEMTALLLALLGPQLAAFLLADGREFELLLPFAGFVSGLLVALVVAVAGPVGLLGFRPAPLRYIGEVALATGAALLLAHGWIYVLEHTLPEISTDGLERLIARLGLPMALLTIAVFPAVLEEIVFRGFLQGRLLALYGTGVGLVVTAAAFAICHGMPAVLPIHFGLGLWLGWLRQRSGSLWPGVLLHFLYNGTLVVLDAP
jgi:membrane protease YdiL (CAAX protease family)